MGEEEPSSSCCFRSNEDDDEFSEPRQVVDRDRSWKTSAFIFVSLSTTITVDILQYSMPLAFLPSVMEDRGHEPMDIATAIGVYYWTGFAGGLMITGYQLYKLFTEEAENKTEAVSVGTAKKHIRYLIYGLGFGTLTLVGQALYPRLWVHTACRFVQGMAGAFIFFYAFLLSVSLFRGQQQVAAMTAASTALNVAEVLGSSLGAWIFANWGQRMVFWSLMIVSVGNQVMLMFAAGLIRGDGTFKPRSTSVASLTPEVAANGFRKIRRVFRSKRMGCSVILIVMAAVVKASVEEVLPFHADHRWGLGPLEIGHLFSIVASAYITSALLAGRIWEHLQDYRVLFGAAWLALLGFCTWAVFLTATLWKDQAVLWSTLVLYGVCLGLTHTPAALLLAEAVDHEEGRAKEAVNAIWNTMWEAGGSLGFLLGGLLAEDYRNQLQLFGSYSICCVLCAGLMMAITGWPCLNKGNGLGASKPATCHASPQPPNPMSALKASLSEAGYGGAA